MRNIIILTFLCCSALASAQVELCDSNRSNFLRQHEKSAARDLTVWVDQLTTRYQAQADLKENRKQIDLALDIVLCAKRKLNKGLIYHCVSDPKRGGWTLPVIGRRVYLSEENFWRYSANYQKAVLIHEATHKCGTNDALYLKPNEKPRNSGFVGWSTIADTYLYWSLRGVCHPDFDC